MLLAQVLLVHAATASAPIVLGPDTRTKLARCDAIPPVRGLSNPARAQTEADLNTRAAACGFPNGIRLLQTHIRFKVAQIILAEQRIAAADIDTTDKRNHADWARARKAGEITEEELKEREAMAAKVRANVAASIERVSKLQQAPTLLKQYEIILSQYGGTVDAQTRAYLGPEPSVSSSELDALRVEAR